jgi:hypothetical protein
MDKWKNHKLIYILVLTTAMLLALTSIALADNLIPDGDYATPVAPNDLVLGDICSGANKSGNVLFAIKRVGGGQVFADNATVTVSVDTLPTNVTASMTDNQIILPNNWVSQSNGTLSSDTASSQVTVNTTGLALGSYNRTVKYNADGNQDGGGTASRPGNLAVTWTVKTCAPANTPPSVSVTGVTNGVSYEFGSVPAAGCSVIDAEDGQPSVAPTLSAISGPLAGYGLSEQTATCSYTDSGGLTATASATYSIVDTTAPIITFVSRTPGANSFGWNNSSVKVEWSCSDSVGVVAATVSQTVTTKGASQSSTGTCTDLAGNTASDTQAGINIDKTAPGILFVSRTPANGNGWNNNDVTVNWSCSDSGSGVVSSTDNQTVSTEGANQSAIGTCTDKAGNTASDTQTGINIDKTAPTATATASPGPNGNGWNNTSVTVSFSGDDGSGSGIDFCSAPVTLSSDGAGQSASGTCTDKAGNVSAVATKSGINIDKTAPTATASASPGPNANGWNNTSVTVSFSGDDGTGSGIDFCSTAVVLSDEGAGQSASGTCTDKAGNVSATATKSGINIDKTPPTLTWSKDDPADGGVYYFFFVPTKPSCTADDVLSGPDSCTVNGWSDAIGSHTMTATAYDLAGNSKDETRSYTVSAWTLKGFFPPVDMDGVVNVVKGGSTVPLKFKIFAGTTELTDIGYILSFTYTSNYCGSNSVEDNIETLATGGTVLRYTDGQFIFNWKTPKIIGCFKVTLTTLDGSKLEAYFRLK